MAYNIKYGCTSTAFLKKGVKEMASKLVELQLLLGWSDEDLIQFAHELNQKIKEIEPTSMEEKIDLLLRDLKIPFNFKGYDYIKAGLIYFLKNQKQVYETRDVYLHIASMFETTPVRIESDIRNAIKRMKDSNSHLVSEIWGEDKKIANKAFFKKLTQYIRKNIIP